MGWAWDFARFRVLFARREHERNFFQAFRMGEKQSYEEN